MLAHPQTVAAAGSAISCCIGIVIATAAHAAARLNVQIHVQIYLYMMWARLYAECIMHAHSPSTPRMRDIQMAHTRYMPQTLKFGTRDEKAPRRADDQKSYCTALALASVCHLSASLAPSACAALRDTLLQPRMSTERR
jgi:hypothetical protein